MLGLIREVTNVQLTPFFHTRKGVQDDRSWFWQRSGGIAHNLVRWINRSEMGASVGTFKTYRKPDMSSAGRARFLYEKKRGISSMLVRTFLAPSCDCDCWQERGNCDRRVGLYQSTAGLFEA